MHFFRIINYNNLNETAFYDVISNTGKYGWGVGTHPVSGEVYFTTGWGGWGPSETPGRVYKIAADLTGTPTLLVNNQISAGGNGAIFVGIEVLSDGSFWLNHSRFQQLCLVSKRHSDSRSK